jgi:outer membrane protein OmpA-like peptidoglycan-associated protein
MMKHVGRAIVTTLLFVTGPVLAQGDAKGTRDHPVIGRFEGAVILAGEVRNFDERVIQSARLGDNDTALGPANSVTRSGAITSLVYEAPGTASSVEIAANYRARLEALGYKPLYACDTAACPGFGPVNRVVRLTFADPAFGLWGFRGGYGRNPRYLLMEKDDGGSRSTVALVVGEAGIAGDAPRYALLVVDQTAMKTDQITVPTTKAITAAFGTEGSIALYGIYFDTGSAMIQPESAPTLRAIAALMNEQPGLALIVVGHTDNTGDFAANIALSQARAAAVAAALTREYKVAASRLTAFGAGMAAPAAPNATEAGRTRNRRVEIVPR